MKSTLLVIAGLLVGALAGGFLSTGIGAGVGVATGLSAGACLTVEAAKQEGFITSEQVDRVLQAAIGLITKNSELSPEEKLSDSDAECAKVIAALRANAAKDE